MNNGLNQVPPLLVLYRHEIRSSSSVLVKAYSQSSKLKINWVKINRGTNIFFFYSTAEIDILLVLTGLSWSPSQSTAEL